MVKIIRTVLWITVPFGLTLLAAFAFVVERGARVMLDFENSETHQPAVMQLVGRTIADSALIEAQSRTSIAGHG